MHLKNLFKSVDFILGLFFALIAIMCVGCSEDTEETVIARFDSSGIVFSPGQVEGCVEYFTDMVPDSVRVVFLDENLDSTGVMKLPVGKNYIAMSNGQVYNFQYVFRSQSVELSTPYVKVVSVFNRDETSEKMEFPQYLNVVNEGSQIQAQNLLDAIAFDRITDLVRDSNYTLNEAIVQAEHELCLNMGISSSSYTQGFKADLFHVVPYFYSRYYVSDSVFYSDFKDLRERARKGTLLDSTVMLRVADAFLEYEETISDESYEMTHRDSIMENYAPYLNLWNSIYGTYMSNGRCDFGTLDTIRNKDSKYAGRTFVFDGNYKWYMWRLASTLEDSIGICLYDSVRFATYGTEYLYCARDSYRWEPMDIRDTIMNYLFGRCNGTRVRIFRDSMYICECNDSHVYGWKEYVPTTDSTDSSAKELEVEARAFNTFGECDEEVSGVKKQLDDSTFVRCARYGWKSIDYATYWLSDDVKEGDVGETPDGRYFQYNSYYGKWVEVLPPIYYGDTCNSTNHRKVVFYDSVLYICKALCSGNCWSGGGTWEVLTGADSIPPVIHNDVCNSSLNNLLLKYDDTYYACKDSLWIVAPDSLLTSPVLDGYICESSLHGSMRIYDDGHFRCDTTRWSWYKLDSLEEALYDIEVEKGKCTAVTGTSLYWNDKAKFLLGCDKIGSSYQWRRVVTQSSPYDFSESMKKEMTKGVYESEDTYRLKLDNQDYLFKYASNFVLSQVSVDDVLYEPYVYNGNIFIHGVRSSFTLNLWDVDGKSDSFDEYYETWKLRAKENTKCNGSYHNEGVDSATIYKFTDSSYMNWEKAKNFCPSGFHIPSSEEFMSDGYLRYIWSTSTARNDAFISIPFGDHFNNCRNGMSLFYNIFWTSDEKDESTHYCVEQANRTEDEYFKMEIVECPKDLYPMVQAICVKD